MVNPVLYDVVWFAAIAFEFMGGIVKKAIVCLRRLFTFCQRW